MERQKRGAKKITIAAVALLCVRLFAAWFTLAQMSRPELEIDLSKRVQPPKGAGDKGLKLAIASMTSPQSTYSDYRWIVDAVMREAGVDGRMTISPTYLRVRKSLEAGDVDAAFVCTGTFARMADSNTIELLAQPELTAGSDYCCVIIARNDLAIHALKELDGHSFAFSDPESNTGCFIPTLQVEKLGVDPQHFFGKIIYTGSHDRSIQAVAAGHVDAAAVDKLVLDKLIAEDKKLGESFHVVWKSPSFGPPPVVVRSNLDPRTKAALRKSLLNLHQNPEARKHLEKIGVNRFLPPDVKAYSKILELYRGNKGN